MRIYVFYNRRSNTIFNRLHNYYVANGYKLPCHKLVLTATLYHTQATSGGTQHSLMHSREHFLKEARLSRRKGHIIDKKGYYSRRWTEGKYFIRFRSSSKTARRYGITRASRIFNYAHTNVEIRTPDYCLSAGY